MGGMASNPFDAEAQKELDGIIKETIAEFGKQYTFALAVNLVKQAQEEMDKKDEKKEEAPQRQLVSDNDPPKEVHKEGYLVKQGIIRKNWLQRYFTINPDYSISYKVKKEDAKEKGKFTLGGYTVLDFDSKDKPFTIHCKHWDKRNWYFQVPKPENKDVTHEDEYKKWKDAFTNAARKAPNPMDPDPLLRRTYQRAYLKTYEKWWGWSSYFYCTGSESEMIGDLIMRRLRWGLLWRVYGKLKGPASIQNKMRDTIGKQVKIAVQAACVAGFKAMAEARDKVKPEMEKQIKENGAPIFEGISKMKSSVQDKLMDVLNPIIEKTANPLVEKVLSKAFTPIANAHVEALKGFKRCCEWYRGGDGKDGWNESTIRRMNWWVWWYLWESRAIMYQMSSDDVVRKALTPPSSGESSGPNDSGEKEDEASNSGLAYKINDQLADQCLAAIFTLGKDKDLNVVVGKFVNDSKILLREQYKSFLLGVIQPNLMALASKTILELVKPLDDALPDLLKNFISGHDMCVEIIKNVSDQIAEKFVETAYAPEAERMEKALKEVFPAEAPKS